MSDPVSKFGLLRKIVSGGQTGVDRAALDVAIFLEIEHGGWCPLGRRAEDGMIPKTYALTETETRNYVVRTERNVIDSDGTLILFRDQLTGGTELTRKLALKHGRPLSCVDLESFHEEEFARLLDWIESQNIQVLNVAGPRESSCEGVGKQAEQFLVVALAHRQLG
jgi:hypothetical protein